MAVRASMANLILRTRRTISGSTTGAALFADQDVQDTLDAHCFFVDYAFPRPTPQYNPGGVLLYNEYRVDQGDWEEDVTILDPSYVPVTPATSDYIRGRWTFSAGYPGQVPPLRIRGKFYDLWAAAADLLEAWAAAVSLQFDGNADGQFLYRSQQATMLQNRADQARAKAMPSTIQAYRGDLDPGWGVSFNYNPWGIS